jgi:hypothetical protein
MNHIAACFENSPILNQLIASRTTDTNHYRLDGDKRLIETTHVRYPNAFGSKMVSILVWERE